MVTSVLTGLVELDVVTTELWDVSDVLDILDVDVRVSKVATGTTGAVSSTEDQLDVAEDVKSDNEVAEDVDPTDEIDQDVLAVAKELIEAGEADEANATESELGRDVVEAAAEEATKAMIPLVLEADVDPESNDIKDSTDIS